MTETQAGSFRRMTGLEVVLAAAVAGLSFVLVHFHLQGLAFLVIAAAAFALVGLARPEYAVFSVAFVVHVNLSSVLAGETGFTQLTEIMLAMISGLLLMRFLARGEIGGAVIRVGLVIGLYFISMMVTALYSIDPFLTREGATGTLKDLLLSLLLVALLTDLNRLRHAVDGVIAGAAFVSAIAAVQYLTGSYGSTWGGFANASVHQIAGELDSWRISGPLSDANYFAQTLVLALPLALARMRGSGRPVLILVHAVAAALIATAILLTFSRGAIIALIIVFIVAFWQRRLQMLAAFGILAVLGSIALGSLPRGYTDRLTVAVKDVAAVITGRGYVQDKAISGRLAEMIVAAHVFTENPVFGIGYNTFEIQYQDTAMRYGLTSRGSDRQAHSLYVEVMAERGLVGGLMLGAVIAIALTAAGRSARRLAEAGRVEDAGLARSILLSLVAYLAAAVFLHDAYPQYFWLLFALACSLPQVTDVQIGARKADARNFHPLRR